jgi:hypothetical protein
MNRRDLLKNGALGLLSIPFVPLGPFILEEKKEKPVQGIWGVDAPEKRRVLDLDEESIVALFKKAEKEGAREVWDYAEESWKYIDSLHVWSNDQGAFYGRIPIRDVRQATYETFYAKTVLLSNKIWIKTEISGDSGQGIGGNFIITSPNVACFYFLYADFLIPTFRSIRFSCFQRKLPLPEGVNNNPGDKNKSYIQYLGDLSCRWRLYQTTLCKPHEIIMGVTQWKNGAVQFDSRSLGYMEARNFVI